MEPIVIHVIDQCTVHLVNVFFLFSAFLLRLFHGKRSRTAFGSKATNIIAHIPFMNSVSTKDDGQKSSIFTSFRLAKIIACSLSQQKGSGLNSEGTQRQIMRHISRAPHPTNSDAWQILGTGKKLSLTLSRYQCQIYQI